MPPNDTSAAFDPHLAALASTRCAPATPLTTDTSHQSTRRPTVVEEKEIHHGLIC